MISAVIDSLLVEVQIQCETAVELSIAGKNGGDPLIMVGFGVSGAVGCGEVVGVEEGFGVGVDVSSSFFVWDLLSER